MPTKQIDLAIIIVTYNSQFWLHKCLQSIADHLKPTTKAKWKVVVVDNDSQDQTASMVVKEFPWVRFIPLQANTGFAVANNIGISSIKAKYYMLLNSDVEFTEQSHLDSMLAYLNKDRSTAVLTPRVEFMDGSLDPACHRGEPTLWASFTYFSKLEQYFPHIEQLGRYHLTTADMHTIHEIEACSGAAMIVRAQAIQQVGLLDERFFMYAEDLDWCKRFRDAQFSIVFYPHSTLIHHKYKSGIKHASQKIASQTKRHFYDTMLQYYDKHYAHHYPRVVRWFVKLFVVIRKGAL